jgi:hypothetical protein
MWCKKEMFRRRPLHLFLLLALLACPPHAAAQPSRPLWQGSQFTEADRARAVRRGLEFIYRTALDEDNFRLYGSDYLWCFYTVGESVSDPAVRRAARRMGVERARLWQRLHRTLPRDSDAQTVADFAFGADASAGLGFRNEHLKGQVRRAAARFGPRDFLLFDPATEAPPADVPDDCGFDGVRNARGAKACRACRRPLKPRTPQDVWYDALITAYVGERYGVRLGASYAEVLRWLPSLRPYRAADPAMPDGGPGFYDTVYALTHVVYTLNDYGLYTLSPRALGDEYEFLRSNLREAVRQRDADMLGEFMDSLRALGLDERDPSMRAGVEYLLANQNADGSWGARDERDIYLRYHPTWNGVAALSRYRWRGPSPRLRKYRHLLDDNQTTEHERP